MTSEAKGNNGKAPAAGSNGGGKPGSVAPTAGNGGGVVAHKQGQMVNL